MYSFKLHHFILLQPGDIAINPASKKYSRMNFYHWNLIAVAARDFKVPLTAVFIKVNTTDIICLSRTFLDSTISLNDERLYIKGYSMIRAHLKKATQKEEMFVYIIKVFTSN